MADRDHVIGIVYEAIEELNEQLSEETRLEKTGEVVLTGEGSKLDSLGLVNLIVGTEQKIEEKLGCRLALYERAAAEEKSPFETVKSLTDYIGKLMDEKENG